MFEKRVIPFGEKMSERHCRLAGYIGQVAVMSRLGVAFEQDRLPPTISTHSHKLRMLCRELADGKYLDVESKFLGGYDEVMMHAANKIGFVRLVNGCDNVLDGDARASLSYHAGQADFRLPTEYRPSFNQLIDYMAEKTRQNIVHSLEVTEDDTDQESHHLLRANTDIAYEVKYLRTDN